MACRCTLYTREKCTGNGRARWFGEHRKVGARAPGFKNTRYHSLINTSGIFYVLPRVRNALRYTHAARRSASPRKTRVHADLAVAVAVKHDRVTSHLVLELIRTLGNDACTHLSFNVFRSSGLFGSRNFSARGIRRSTIGTYNIETIRSLPAGSLRFLSNTEILRPAMESSLLVVNQANLQPQLLFRTLK